MVESGDRVSLGMLLTTDCVRKLTSSYDVECPIATWNHRFKKRLRV